MSDPDLLSRTREACAAARQTLLAERREGGWWEGELSSSALSTAVAVLALDLWGQDNGEHADALQSGLQWLAATQNPDGGWGDTPVSLSNPATTLLAWSALGGSREKAAGQGARTVVEKAEAWIRREAGGLDAKALQNILSRRYGKDRTFAVPILMTCAVGGRLGATPSCWKSVPALPFELAALPRSWFAALRLPVVSYALPALIAIGQVRAHHAPARGPWAWVRRGVVARTLRLLQEIQPSGGGFLEATPLTAFVTMALLSAGQRSNPVAARGISFLVKSMRQDGSWPIDSNLATWGTTLSVKALAGDLPAAENRKIRRWLLDQQYHQKHPYCLSPPGGWAWTDLPGGVPDADDTAGAMLALHLLQDPASMAERGEIRKAASAGAQWLLGLQNRDGGMPTFCRGWGALPFDRSAPDLTAHALAAWQTWRETVPVDLLPAMRGAVAWLTRIQSPEGSWDPLWFGNEWSPSETNPVFGTAVILNHLSKLPSGDFPGLPAVLSRGVAFLLNQQQADGAWSGGGRHARPSIEETSAVLLALLGVSPLLPPGAGSAAAVKAGLEALLQLTHGGTQFEASPIGLYFAKLWYYERLYPIVGAAGALRATLPWLESKAAAS